MDARRLSASQEKMRAQRGTLRVLTMICRSRPLKLFLVYEICFLRRLHRVQPRSEVFSEKVIFNDNWRIGRGDLKTFFVGIQEVTTCRVRKELLNYNYYLIA